MQLQFAAHAVNALFRIFIYPIIYLALQFLVTTDVQNPRVRYVGFNVNLTCEFAEGSTAEVCFFNFTGMTAQQTFLVNRAVNTSVASSCAMTDAVADNVDFGWSAFDNIAGIPITVELIPVDEDHFECGPGRHYISLVINNPQLVTLVNPISVTMNSH